MRNDQGQDVSEGAFEPDHSNEQKMTTQVLRLSRFWVAPLVVALFVVGPFLIWGEALTSMATPDPRTGEYPGGARWMWLIGIALLVADIAIPVPTTSIIAALGIVYGPVFGAIIAIAGSLLAATTGYALGRGFGRPAAARFLGPSLARGEQLFSRHGGWIVAASRWMPVLPEVVSVVAGIGRMRFAGFLAAALCGVTPFCAVFALLGHLGAERPILTVGLSALFPLILWWGASKSGLAPSLRLERDQPGRFGDG